jgi:peptidoglycan L-alanyl-D-glutamate endopeptidase CwlK
MSYSFGKNSLKHQEGLNPDLKLILKRALEISVFDFGVPQTGGARSAETQNRLYLDGKSQLDGLNHLSNHQSGNAVDVFAIDPETGKASWDHEMLAVIAAAMLQAASELETAPLRWGGLWGHYGRNGAFCDRPHFELVIED